MTETGTNEAGFIALDRGSRYVSVYREPTTTRRRHWLELEDLPYWDGFQSAGRQYLQSWHGREYSGAAWFPASIFYYLSNRVAIASDRFTCLQRRETNGY